MTSSAIRYRRYPSGRLPRDRVLLSVCLIGGLVMSYQLGVTLLHPPWIGPATDWLRAALAWPQLVVVVGVSHSVTRTRQADARSWWMVSTGLLSYTVARTLWTVADTLIFPQGVPFPSWPDLFFVLQYPCFFLAVMLLPSAPPWVSRLKRILDCLLWTGAVTALSWYFVLAPRYMQSGMSPLANLVCLTYPVGDLALLCGLVVALLRSSRLSAYRLVLYGLCLALVCLTLADSWVNALLLKNPQHVYVTGNPPDLFWLAFYLLVPLAALVRLRLVQYEPLMAMRVQALTGRRLQRQDLLIGLRFLAPIAAMLLACAVITIHAMFASASAGWRSLAAPVGVSFGLLLLLLARAELAFLEYLQLEREGEVVRLDALALREANRGMEAFLSTLSHELKTPLTALSGSVQLLVCRMRKALLTEEQEQGRTPEDSTGNVVTVGAVAKHLESRLDQLQRLVDDVLDVSRIQSGRLAWRWVPCDLWAIVRAAVEEQRLVAGSRTIRLEPHDDARPVSVTVDASHVGQVVTNYLTNACKYSREDRPIVVRLRVDGELACVSVQDEGIGVAPAEQAHIWERFHRAAGGAIQSGSDVGVGIGLYLSKTIIDRHHGQVGMSSIPGQGSTFWFTLPMTASDR